MVRIDNSFPPVNNIHFGNKVKMYNQLLYINNSIPCTIEKVIQEINTYDPTLIKFWEEAGLKNKLTTYLLHYVIPFNELLVSENKSETRILTSLLLSCFAWRSFDNCVDKHLSPKNTHTISLRSCLQLVDYIHYSFSLNSSKTIQSHYDIMIEQSLNEIKFPIKLDDIWKRCSIFLLAPETLGKLNDENISIFKNYINYTGLAHDMNDIISDLSAGIISLPISWLRKDNPYDILDVKSVDNVYRKAKIEVKHIEEYFEKVEIRKNYPIIDFMLIESNKIMNQQ